MARAAKKVATVAAESWTPDSRDGEGNPVFPEGVERIDMTGGNSCLVVLPDNDSIKLSDYRDLDACLTAYNES
jgi:hypothetical protein